MRALCLCRVAKLIMRNVATLHGCNMCVAVNRLAPGDEFACGTRARVIFNNVGYYEYDDVAADSFVRASRVHPKQNCFLPPPRARHCQNPNTVRVDNVCQINVTCYK